MADESSVPPAPDQPPSGPRGRSPEEAAPAERYGIVAVSRHVKDDGRARLLYTREEQGG